MFLILILTVFSSIHLIVLSIIQLTMAGTVIEMVSTRNLVLMVSGLLLLQITFFLIGGLVAPKPSDAQEHIMINCYNRKHVSPLTRSECDERKDLYKDTRNLLPEDLTLMTEIPRRPFAMTPWFQYLLALLSVRLEYKKDNPYNPNATMLLKVDIFYSDNPDWKARGKPEEWKKLASCEEERYLNCVFNQEDISDDGDLEGYEYDCDLLHLFQLGSVPHKYYLINLGLPVEHNNKIYNLIGSTREVSVIGIRQTGGFTKVWMCLKVSLTLMMIFPVVWFWRRIRELERKPSLLEKAIFSLGISMLFLNLPLELISIYFEAPWMMFFTDLRQGLFYVVLLSFWIIFIGEHMLDQAHRNKLSSYKWQLGSIFTCTMALLIFDIAERGVQLINPCATAWTHHNVAMALLVVASIAGCAYFILLLYMVIRVFRTISYRQQMAPERAKSLKTIVFRFRVLMALSVVTAGLTIVFYVLSQKYDGLLDYDDYKVQVNSAFFTGVYGLWNIYLCLVLAVYAPSHKKVIAKADLDRRQEHIELNCTSENVTEASEHTRILELTQEKDQQD